MYDDLYKGMNSRSGKQARRQVVRYNNDDDNDADCYNSYDHNLNYDNDDAVDDTFKDNADHNGNTIYVIYKGSSRRSKSRRLVTIIMI
jgi:hypothetical protein